VYEHGKEDHDRRKKRRIEPSASLPNGKHSAGKNGEEDSEAGPRPESEADARAASFSCMASYHPHSLTGFAFFQLQYAPGSIVFLS